MQVQDEMNNVNRTCTLSDSDDRWRVIAAIRGGLYAVINLSNPGGWARLVTLSDMHNLS